jgi:hypothetical protein
MDTIRIACREVVSPASFGALMNGEGAHTSGNDDGYSLERGDAIIFLSIEDQADRDVDSLDRIRPILSWAPHTSILVTVGRHEGSLFLAFELASAIAARWNGLIHWGGLDQWEQWFQDWQQSRKH